MSSPFRKKRLKPCNFHNYTSFQKEERERERERERESRKWNLSIGDIPKIITDELATTVVILGSGTEKSVESLAQRFGLNGACRDALSRLGKPGRKGSNLIALFRTGTGMSQLILSLTIGPQSLWAFSTITEDVTIRNNLYQRLGPSEVLRRRGRVFRGNRPKRKWNAADGRSRISVMPTTHWSTSRWKSPTK